MTASRLAASVAALALGMVAVAAGPASAQTDATDNTATHYWYGMIGYSNHEAISSNLGTLDGRLGARWGWIGVEGEASWGVNHSRIGNHFTGVTDVPGITAGLNNQQTIYGVGYLPLGRGIDLFARAGYGRTDWNFKGMAHPDDDQTNWNIGGGGQWFWDLNNGVRAEYTRENFSIVSNSDDWSISYVRKF